MHFLAAQEADLAELGTACDLRQSAGDIIFLSAADSELAVLARAQAFLIEGTEADNGRLAKGSVSDGEPTQPNLCTPSLRLANLRDLQHPASIDLYIEQTLSHSRLVIARILGGAEYFPYFCEQVEQACRKGDIALAFLAGDRQEDQSLYRRSSLSLGDLRCLYGYLLHGGFTNSVNFLRAAARLVVAQRGAKDGSPTNNFQTNNLQTNNLQTNNSQANGLRAKNSAKSARISRPPLAAARPLPEAGLYEMAATAKFVLPARAPRAYLFFYRALLQADDTQPIDALINACAKEGIALSAIYVSSLKSKSALEFLHKQLKSSPPEIMLNATGFALGEGQDPLAAYDCSVLQIAFSSHSLATWRNSRQGLSATDLAMQVVLPEMDGRVFTRATAFKRRSSLQASTQFAPVRLRAQPDRCAYVARLAAAWVRLRSLANGEKPLAIMLHNYPYRDGRIANGVGLDTPRSLQTILTSLAQAGYDLGNNHLGDDCLENNSAKSLQAESLIARLREGPTNENPSRDSSSPVRLSARQYLRFFSTLKPSLRAEVEELWGKVTDETAEDANNNSSEKTFDKTFEKTSENPSAVAFADPFFRKEEAGYFSLPIVLLGKVALCLQPSRGYDRDPSAIAHDPALAPPHSYLAQYFWLTRVWHSAAILHLGKHGTAEWLPGKSLALSRACACEAVLAPIPHLYPFIVSDPGEGTQAKRRGAAVILDHLSPPLARAMLYGDSAELERLLDEYAEARLLHPRRARVLASKVAELGKRSGILEECGIDASDLSGIEDTDDLSRATLLSRLDGHICDLKELQIRNGLHRFGEPQGASERTESLCALLRLPRGTKEGQDSLPRAIYKDLCRDLHKDGNSQNSSAVASSFSASSFDPLDASSYGKAWRGPWNGDLQESLPDSLSTPSFTPSPTPSPDSFSDSDQARGTTKDSSRASAFDTCPSFFAPYATKTTIISTTSANDSSSKDNGNGSGNGSGGIRFRCWGDVVSALERYGEALLSGSAFLPAHFSSTRSVLSSFRKDVAPLFDSCASSELSSLLRGFSGLRISPGPSGAPSRGRLDVLPTGRNFFSVDVRALPSESAWQLGWRSSCLLIDRYCEEHGDYPRRIALSAWGTSCMRTAGEDAAQMLALLGVRPLWHSGSGRVDSFEILPLGVLSRPRVDVTLRISGFFRDAFPSLIALLDSAVRSVGKLDEPASDNPIAASVRSELSRFGDSSFYRIFGSPEGSYGTGLNIPLDSGCWSSEEELAETYLRQTSSAYGAEGFCASGARSRSALERRLGSLDAIIHNQDNREHDILDSDDYYQFEGGLSVSAHFLSGKRPAMYHNDHSRPFSPRVLRLEHEIARIVRARAANPKWIAAMRKHGYKGASEIAATLDYLFAFAATTRLVKSRHFEMLFDAYLLDEETRAFLSRVNRCALRDIAARFQEARERGFWQTQRNDVPSLLDNLLATGTDCALSQTS